jgi:hypothetical protein
MSTAPTTHDVMTYREVAEHTGLTVNALHQRTHAGAMPAPDGRVGSTPFWMRETILRWAPNGHPDSRPRRTRSDKGVPRRKAAAVA